MTYVSAALWNPCRYAALSAVERERATTLAIHQSVGIYVTCEIGTGATPSAIDCEKLQGIPAAAVIPCSPILVMRTCARRQSTEVS